jgi:hypothetical protein
MTMNLQKTSVCACLLLLSGPVGATEHWTAEIEQLTVFENKSAFVIVSNPRGGPSGTFNCTQNVVYLGVKNSPVTAEFLSQAMVIYAAGKTMRFGIRGSGTTCETEYVTAQ